MPNPITSTKTDQISAKNTTQHTNIPKTKPTHSPAKEKDRIDTAPPPIENNSTQTYYTANSIPSITPPDQLNNIPKSPYLKIACAMQDLEALETKITATQETLTEHFKSQILKAQHQHFLEMKKNCESYKTLSTINTLSQISTVLTTSTSLAIGSASIATGHTIMGGALIFCATISVANVLLKDLDLWTYVAQIIAPNNESMQTNIITLLPSAIGATSSILIITCSVGASVSFAGLNISDQLIEIGKKAVSLIKASTNVATLTSTYKIKSEEKEITLLDTEMKNLNFQISDAMLYYNNFIKQQTQTLSATSKLMKMHLNNISLTQQTA